MRIILVLLVLVVVTATGFSRPMQAPNPPQAPTIPANWRPFCICGKDCSCPADKECGPRTCVTRKACDICSDKCVCGCKSGEKCPCTVGLSNLSKPVSIVPLVRQSQPVPYQSIPSVTIPEIVYEPSNWAPMPPPIRQDPVPVVTHAFQTTPVVHQNPPMVSVNVPVPAPVYQPAAVPSVMIQPTSTHIVPYAPVPSPVPSYTPGWTPQRTSSQHLVPISSTRAPSSYTQVSRSAARSVRSGNC